MKPTTDSVMTTDEAVKYLKISRKTLLKLIQKGEIPAKKVGKNYRYLREEIDKFLRGEEQVNFFE